MNRRKVKLIRPDTQIKVVLVTLFVACFVLLIQFQLSFYELWNLSNRVTSSMSAEAGVELMRTQLIRKFVIALAIAVPLAVSVGILYSFKFAGPIFRFKKYFTELKDGRWDHPCKLRERDDLQDVAVSLNEGLDVVRARLKSQEAILQDLQQFFAGQGFAADGRSRDDLEKLKGRIALEREEYARRFPPPAAPQPMAEVKEPAVAVTA